MFAPYKIKVGVRAVALALALASSSFSAHAVLERAGPVNADPAVGNFPAWYQDSTGIGLEFCAPNAAEVDGAWCLLTPPIQTPEIFPSNFFDEHFYFAGLAQIGSRQQGGKAILVLGEEAGFATGNAVPGEQIVFSRIRVALNPVPVSGTYRFIHPYGEESIEGVAGERIFFTDDVGISCAKGTFDCALTSRMGPFLLPSATAGGAEMPAVTADNPTPDTDPAHFAGGAPTPYPNSGKAYIADPARIGPVTGSLLSNFIDSSGASRNHNIFRIEGPAGAGLGVDPLTGAVVDWIETTDFSLMGRLYVGAMPAQATVDRASYTRIGSAPGELKVDVLATGFPATAGRLPTQPPAGKEAAALTFFDAPCAGTVDATGIVRAPFSAPLGATETQMLSSDNQYWGQIQPTVLPAALCVTHANARDLSGQIVPAFQTVPVTDEVSITQARYDQGAKTLSVLATSSDALAPPVLRLAYGTFTGNLSGGQIVATGIEVPPPKITVLSSAGGANGLLVDTLLASVAAAGTPVAKADSFTFQEDSTLHVLNPRASTATNPPQAGGTGSAGVDTNCALNLANPCTMQITSPPALGTLGTVNQQQTTGPTVTYTPSANRNGVDSFTYTLTKNGLVSTPATVHITLTPVNDAPVAVNDSATATVNVPLLINLIANDTDVDGNATIVGASSITQPAGASVTRSDGTALGTTNVIGGVVQFLAATAGTYTFTYRTTDAVNVSSVSAGTVTVRVNPAETLLLNRNGYTTSTRNLTVEGATSPASNSTVTIEFCDSVCSTALGHVSVAGTTAAVAGKFKLSVTVPRPVWATHIRGRTSAGAVTLPTVLSIK